MLKRFAPITLHQTGKVLALTFLWLGVLYAAGVTLISLGAKGTGLGASLGIAIVILVIFPISGYVSAALFAWVYNWAARRVGGVKLMLEDIAED